MSRSPLAVHIDPVKPQLAVEQEVLESAGVLLRARRCADDDEVVALAADAQALMCLAYPVTDQLLARLPDLRMVVRYGVGIDNVDLEAATRRGVVVCNVPDYCIDEVANHTVAMLLTLNRKLLPQTLALRAGASAPLRPMGPLAGETLGLVGFGRLARAVVDRLRPFGLRFVAYDPFLPEPSVDGVPIRPLDEVLAAADYLSIHAPMSQATQGLIGQRELALLRPGAYVVNTARGGVIDEAALGAALASGRLAGAGIDVWQREPVRADDPLLAFENVVATNHTAFFSDRSLVRLRQRAAETVARFLTTGVAENAVNDIVASA